MAHTAARCTQADIARVIRAVEQTGADMAVEVLPDGTIRISRRGEERIAAPDVDTPREIRL